MNFFEQQDLAHRNTKRLVVLLCLAVISLIAITTLLFAIFLYYSESTNHQSLETTGLWQGITQAMTWKMVAGISVCVCAIIFLGSFFKLIQLSSGGRAVAESLGGRPINILNATGDEKKILNVVEEMAIASGTPVPPVYIIEDEAINAFAAGHTPQDAVIGVTRGCIRVLKRDELQGVIAHEFSHIFHGDMKLNLRLVALLNGILLLGHIGEFLLRSSGHGSAFRSRNKSSAGMLGLGVGLLVIGYTGTFFGKLIKAAVSRQREFLADASAVKFTRNPDGISGALKKLGGYVGGSQMNAANASEFSHLFFGEGTHSFFNALATHPPLGDRIKRIDPRWDGSFSNINVYEASANSYIEEGRLSDEAPIHFSSPKTATEFAATVDHVIQSIGTPDQSHLAYAHQTLNNISDAIHQAAHNPWEAQALMFGLLLDKDSDKQLAQWQALNALFSEQQLQSLKHWAQQASLLEPCFRLPLVELSLPALKNLSSQQYQHFKTALTGLIRADDRIDLLEWALFRIIKHNLEAKKISGPLLDVDQLHSEARILLSVIANSGTHVASAAAAAFNAGKLIIGLNDATLMSESDYSLADLDLAVTRLNRIKPLQKPKLLKAMSQCVLADQHVSVAEAELFRAIADTLDCPVPPLIIVDR